MVEGAEYPLLPGTVLLLRPYEYHYVCPEEGVPYERYVIHFDEGISFENESTLACFRDERFGAGVYFPRESLDVAVQHAFETLDTVPRFAENEVTLLPVGKVMVRSIVTQILLLLGAARPAEPVAPQKDLLFGVIGYINRHLNENLTVNDIYDPEVSIRYGTYYLRYLFEKFHNWDTVFAAYNGGEGNVAKWLNDPAYSNGDGTLKSIPFPETARYVQKINDNIKYYKSTYYEE